MADRGGRRPQPADDSHYDEDTPEYPDRALHDDADPDGYPDAGYADPGDYVDPVDYRDPVGYDDVDPGDYGDFDTSYYDDDTLADGIRPDYAAQHDYADYDDLGDYGDPDDHDDHDAHDEPASAADEPRRRAKPVAVGPPRPRLSRTERARRERRRRARNRRRRVLLGLGSVLAVALTLTGIFFGSQLLHSHSGPVTDYRGDGKSDLLFEIHPGDTTQVIAQALQRQGVIATEPVFLEAARGKTGIVYIQPGFYKLRTEVPAATAITELLDPNNRIGKLVIPEGRQLDDTRDAKTEQVTAGVFSLISDASCVELNGDKRCMPVADLRLAAETATPEQLHVPSWAAKPVLDMGRDHRRIEGLITAGTWNVNPNASATEVLASLIADSAGARSESGLPNTAEALHFSPYELLVVASLVQREALPADFAKVARVIYNRLDAHQRLEFDSTVNYPLDHQEVATTDADRAKETPWNTYASSGLPATPICSPGAEALEAAAHPEPGDWLYFVTIDKQGTTLFTHSYQEHLANIRQALDNGVLDSSR